MISSKSLSRAFRFIDKLLVMRGWRLDPWALRIIRGSGGSVNKKLHSDYLRVGRGCIR